MKQSKKPNPNPDQNPVVPTEHDKSLNAKTYCFLKVRGVSSKQYEAVLGTVPKVQRPSKRKFIAKAHSYFLHIISTKGRFPFRGGGGGSAVSWS